MPSTSSTTTLPQRPSMQARDASGQNVSLLNDDASMNRLISRPPQYLYHSDVRSHSPLSGSDPSSPPELVRGNSFDDYPQGPLSPSTPVTLLPEYGVTYEYKGHPHYDYRERMPSYEEYPPVPQYIRSSLDSRSAYSESQIYEEEYQSPTNSDRGQKRYPCRYKDSHGCEKTFTTSGHASRHSKIHTAEKAVSCTWNGCPKKFTRADNMKQHLETHTKEKSRVSTSSSAPKSSPRALTQPARVQKPAIGRPMSRPSISTEVSPQLVDPAILRAILASPSTNRGTGLEVLASACASQKA